MNTGAGCHSLLLEIFPIQGSNLGLLQYRQTLCHLSHYIYLCGGEGLCQLTGKLFPYTEIISSFHFWMTNAPKLSAASLLRACTCSSSPDTSDPSVALSTVECLRLVPHASPNQPEDRGEIWGPPDPTALLPVDLLHGQERWSQFGVSVFTQMLIWEERKVRWVWNLLKPVNLTSSVVKL